MIQTICASNNSTFMRPLKKKSKDFSNGDIMRKFCYL